MKKFLSALICATIAIISAFGLTGCNKEQDSVSFYMPDGATALAAAQLMNGESPLEREVDYNVIDASLISSCITGENPKADLCILPLNIASKLLGNGETYKMLGTVTHGNLYILKKQGGEDITLNNIEILKGRTVGVIQLANVPGLTFKTILKDNGLEYAETGNSNEIDENKVNLKAVSPEQVLPTDTTCDYFVVPEPAASAKEKATKGALSFAGSLQTLYGGSNGYPQAVLVAKNSLIESDSEFIEKLILAITQSTEWLLSENTSAETIVNAVKNHLTEGLNPSFTAANLSKTVIKNCAVNFVRAKDCKEEVNEFIKKLIAVNPSSASAVADNFYYNK